MAHSFLVAAGLLSAAVALFHVIAAFSPSLSLYFGAPPKLVTKGPWALGAAALLCAGVFAAWAAFAFSAAGWLPRLPWLRPGLVAIGLVYTARGVLLAPQLLARSGLGDWSVPTEGQHVLSSVVSLAIGLVHLVGAALSWPELVH
jgi:hypothetical protein